MQNLLLQIKKALTENQIMVVLLALVLGLVLPDYLKWLNAYSTHLLITVFFTSSLRLSFNEIKTYAKDWRMLLITNAFMLVVMPLALFLPATLLSPEWSLALLILGAMPTGMTIALVADFFGGKTSLALVITATTSLLAPFTIPLIFKIAVNKSVPIPVIDMFWSLFLTIVIPFILASLVKRAIPRTIKKYDNVIRTISVVCFGILIAGIVAGTSSADVTNISLRDVIILAAATAWLGILTWVSYYIVGWRTPSERITVALCMMYMNNTLALFVADRFFASYGVVPKLLLLLLVVNALFPPLKWAAMRVTKTKETKRLNRNPIT